MIDLSFRGEKNLEKEMSMKLVIAIIQPDKLIAVRDALQKVEVHRLTVSHAQGYGAQMGYTESYRGNKVKVNLIDKLRLEIAVNDKFLNPTVDAILASAKTGKKGAVGDGKIFVLPIEDVIRVRTGESGSKAI